MRELLLKIMAVLAKVGTLREQLPSVLVDPCLYYCCTAHQALAALRSLCTEGCVRTARSMCVGVHNVIREFIWTPATLLCAQIRTGFMTSTVHVHAGIVPRSSSWQECCWCCCCCMEAPVAEEVGPGPDQLTPRLPN